MEFRPCIDIHNGKVKQIVGGSFKKMKGIWQTKILFLDRMRRFMQSFIKKEGFCGGHIILLKCKRQRILRGRTKKQGGECVTGVSGRSAGWRRHHG